ncbi:hypothetical protein [Sphingomonas elodea]|uniref:hypothetical protein n=1 Tax=Sphingomonas elodea TaxID=179878 RepID=UPI0002631E3F|nr:hypothetical protein [Sphingomonas elodea]
MAHINDLFVKDAPRTDIASEIEALATDIDLAFYHVGHIVLLMQEKLIGSFEEGDQDRLYGTCAALLAYLEKTGAKVDRLNEASSTIGRMLRQ